MVFHPKDEEVKDAIFHFTSHSMTTLNLNLPSPRDPGGSLCKWRYWEGLVPISVRVKGAECMGAKLQSHIPAQVNMGYIFRKKKYGSITPKI